jgi:hypothetical protein
MAMKIRKIAVVGSFAAGAALALAPFAAADDLTPVVDTEIASLNALFLSDAALVGDFNEVTHPTLPGEFSVVIPNDIGTVQDNGTTPFDFLIYGVNPTEAGLASDPGAYNVFNGALVNFDDAYNVELWSLMNPGAPIDTIPMADLFGSASGIAEALGTGTATGAITDFMTDGWNDLLGYFGVFAPV